MRKLGLMMTALVALGASVALSGGAEAMPIGLPGSTSNQVSNVDQVRWVCGPWRCWWRPNYYVAPAYAYYGYGPRFGYYGGWHHWHHWHHW
jgi:hypothetical protein